MATNVAGQSPLSIESDFIIVADVPNQPVNLIRLHASSTYITIGWSQPTYDGGSSITGYKIIWDSASGGLVFSEIATVELSDSLLFTYQQGIIVGKTYVFKVIAVNAIGDSEPS
jgi:hypothetical protein